MSSRRCCAIHVEQSGTARHLSTGRSGGDASHRLPVPPSASSSSLGGGPMVVARCVLVVLRRLDEKSQGRRRDGNGVTVPDPPRQDLLGERVLELALDHPF